MKPSQSLLSNFEAEIAEYRQHGYIPLGLHQDSIVVSATPEAVEELGYSIEELLGMNSWFLFDASSFQEVASKLFQKSSIEYNAVMKRKDGTTFNAHLSILHTHIGDETVRFVFYKVKL